MKDDSHPVQKPMASPAQDARKLKASGQASAAELKEFLNRIRGKSAGEVLDVMAASGLVRGMVTASIGMGILVLVFTVVPYAWSEVFSADEAGPATEEVAAEGESGSEGAGEGAASAEGESGNGEAPAGDPAAAGDGAPGQPASTDPLANPQDTADKMGIGETRVAPSNVNPLENSTDDLLKDLD